TIQAEQKGRLAVTADSAKNAALASLEDSQNANTRAETAKIEAVKAKDEALRLLAEAETANDRADEAVSRLRSELTVSNIERGRLYGLVGSLRQAESLIWHEWLDDP